jgi:hypothetical protein
LALMNKENSDHAKLKRIAMLVNFGLGGGI